MRFTVDAISGLAFGRDINTLESGDDVIQRHLDKVLPAIFRRAFSRIPTWRYFKTERDRQLDHSIGVIHIKDLLPLIGQPNPDLRRIKRELVPVPEMMAIK
jgi:Mg2+/Co2+ transporter CorC